MILKSILFSLLLAVLLQNKVFAQDAPDVSANYDPIILTTQQKIAKLQARRAELDKAISRCDANEPGRDVWCTREGYGSRKWSTPLKELQALQIENKSLDGKLAELNSQAVRESNKAFGDKQKAVMAKYTEDVKGLMVTKKELDADLKGTALDLKLVYLKLDQSMLGDYTKYVAQEYAKSNEMKAQICKTAAKCADIVKMGADAKNMSVKIKTLEEYRAGIEAERAKRDPPTPAKAAVDEAVI